MTMTGTGSWVSVAYGNGKFVAANGSTSAAYLAGGTTWTAIKPVPITSTGIKTYTLGGTADTWGHTPWTTTQLNTTNFRIRVTDVATTANKDFRLDYLGVQVTYTP